MKHQVPKATSSSPHMPSTSLRIKEINFGRDDLISTQEKKIKEKTPLKSRADFNKLGEPIFNISAFIFEKFSDIHPHLHFSWHDSRTETSHQDHLME